MPSFGANRGIVNGARHLVGDFVHVDSGSSNEWVARILEIRASDEYHVYARVYWMYSPHDLPCKTARNHGRAVERSQFYGHDEMIASNHSKCIVLRKKRSQSLDIDRVWL